MDVLKDIPKGQRVVLTYYSEGDDSHYYIITQDKYDKFFLYEVTKEKIKKLRTSDDPTKFTECYPNK